MFKWHMVENELPKVSEEEGGPYAIPCLVCDKYGDVGYAAYFAPVTYGERDWDESDPNFYIQPAHWKSDDYKVAEKDIVAWIEISEILASRPNADTRKNSLCMSDLPIFVDAPDEDSPVSVIAGEGTYGTIREKAKEEPESEDLRECPMCGGTQIYEVEDESGKHFGLTCDFCGCGVYGYVSKAAAAHRWNYRYHEHHREGDE